MAKRRLGEGINPRTRFLIMLAVVYLLSLPLISWISYVIQRGHAIRHAYGAGQLYLTAIEEIRNYVGDVLRPKLYEAVPGEFILEGMSRNFVSGSIAWKVNEAYPGYQYKNAILRQPKNPRNLADDFEADIIRRLKEDPELREWRGIREMDGAKFYVIARQGKPFTEGCLRCHGDPADAPRGLMEQYGPTAGFNIEAGALLDGKFVYIPIELPLAEASRNVLIYIGLYTVFFGVIFLVINARFRKLYDRIEAHQRETEVFNADLTELNQELETLVAERTMSVMALTVADRVRNPAAVIGLTAGRFLENEGDRVSDSVRKTLGDIMAEAAKLEGIVKDFGALLGARKSMFTREDLNAIVQVTMPVIEREAAKKGISLTTRLSAEPLMINTHKSLLRAAIFHLARNALESTPEGGAISVSTESSDDRVVFTISDTGAGIAKEDMERIFEPFFSTKPHRFGVGLPLVRQVVSEHLGDIKVESEPGKGATFTISLPARWLEAEQARG